MQKDFTFNNLVLLLYKETGVSDSLAFYEALEAQPELAAEFEQLAQAKQLLPKVQFSPSKNIVKEILAYSDHRTLV